MNEIETQNIKIGNITYCVKSNFSITNENCKNVVKTIEDILTDEVENNTNTLVEKLSQDSS